MTDIQGITAIRIRTAVIRWLGIVIGLVLLALVALETTQVTLRYVLLSGLSWARDVSTILLICMAWLGAPLLWASRGHIAVDIALARIGPVSRFRITLILNLSAAVLSTAFAFVCVQAIVAFQVIELPTLGVSAAVKFYPILAGTALLVAVALLNVLCETKAPPHA